jgi:hypothetical protein
MQQNENNVIDAHELLHNFVDRPMQAFSVDVLTVQSWG